MAMKNNPGDLTKFPNRSRKPRPTMPNDDVLKECLDSRQQTNLRRIRERARGINKYDEPQNLAECAEEIIDRLAALLAEQREQLEAARDHIPDTGKMVEQWVKCSERLPERKVSIEWYEEVHETLRVGERDPYNDQVIHNNGTITRVSDYTHWRPHIRPVSAPPAAQEDSTNA